LFLAFIDDGMHVHKLTYAALQFRTVFGSFLQSDRLLR